LLVSSSKPQLNRAPNKKILQLVAICDKLRNPSCPPSSYIDMVTVRRLASLLPDAPKAHHVGNPPTSFVNPWPSFDSSNTSGLAAVKTRFARDRPAFIPVPDRSELVPVRKVDFETKPSTRVTWIGHASFLVQTSTAPGASRGLNILCDPVFAERTSPVTWAGPKRYTPTPCTLQELVDGVDVDLVILSHNHYDHADTETLKFLHKHRQGNVHFLTGLNNSRWLTTCGIPASQITELDWWDPVEVEVENVGAVRITCTPTQHFSSRGIFDRGCDLWCSYAIQELTGQSADALKNIYFSGDTGYRSITGNMTREEEDALPACPEFKRIGELLGPFDLSMLPIGLCTPRAFMSPVHVNSWDSVKIHKEIKSKKSIGMHWGTVRGGLSQEYEDVRTPPRDWKTAAEDAGLTWGQDVGLMDIGETLIVE